MLVISYSNLVTAYDELIDLETVLYDLEFELQFPIHMLGNKLRYILATERRILKHKINNLEEDLYEQLSDYGGATECTS